MDKIYIIIIIGIIILLLATSIGLLIYFLIPKEAPKQIAEVKQEEKPKIIPCIKKEIKREIVMEPCYYDKQCECNC
jgi:hypothetical protein